VEVLFRQPGRLGIELQTVTRGKGSAACAYVMLAVVQVSVSFFLSFVIDFPAGMVLQANCKVTSTGLRSL
jgi:hypothetical protein